MLPHGFNPNSMQYRPAPQQQQQQQQQQQFMPPASASQQFRPVGQQNHFSQPMHQFPPRPGQSSFQQPFQPQYIPSPQQNVPVPVPSNQLPGPGASFSLSYTFQPPVQMHVPVAGQPQMPPGSSVPPLQPSTHQAPTSATASDSNGAIAARQGASDWQEFESSDGRRYYYNKVTKHSSWEKPLELMTPIEMSWKSGEYNNCSKCTI